MIRARALVVPLLLGLLGCGGPIGMLPGGALSGELASATPGDWSLVEDSSIDLETRPDDPYSVELGYIVKNGKLYIDPAEGRRWLEHIRADPRVRVRFGATIYELRAVQVKDAVELEGFPEDRIIYRLDPRG